MLYLKPLSAVTQHELQAVGYRAQDLALLSQHQIPVPPTVVVLSNAFEEVLRIGNLRYKIDYLFSHAQETVQQSLVNLYTGARKALYEAKLPSGFETELREMYDSITKPVAIGELVAEAERPPVRVMLSGNRLDDPEDNTVIIQAVNGFDELLSAVREGWALAYAPSLLRARLRERYSESRLRVALIIQVMDRRPATSHVYSCLPQDHKKAYIQAYLGYPDLRERIAKDYYAIGKWSLRVLASDVVVQSETLDLDAKKDLVVTKLERPVAAEKIVDRDLLELARLTRKAERLLMTPVKAFYASNADDHELLWVNRLGFDTMIPAEDETSAPAAPAASPAPKAEDFLLVTETPEVVVTTPLPPSPIVEKVVETETPAQSSSIGATESVTAKLLSSSLVIVKQIVERKYRSAFGETPVAENIADAINRLNGVNTFSRPVDGAVLLQAEDAVKASGTLSAVVYAKAVGEVAFLMGYA